ncbi:MAG TPA: VCBS repeat-containing protein, partial [Candidatus Krumholzibacteria bacterium]|nr:VCBS repeat-containing protein [Candidatus Krumholzibacteria bacterium]
MSSSRGSWAALVLCTLLSMLLFADTARSAAVAPWFQSHSLSTQEATRQLLARSSARMRVSGAKASQMEALHSHKAPDSLRMLVVGCDFADSLLWGRDRSQFPGWPAAARQGNFLYDDSGNAITDAQGKPIYEFAAHDSTYFDLQMRKTADYFSTVSRGKFTLQWQALSTLVNLPESMGYYGADRQDNNRLVEMAKQVVEAIDPEVDFSGFDTLVLIHAGAGRETDISNDSPQQLFSNYLDRRDFEQAMADTILSEPGIITQDGVLIRHVLILPETETQDAVASLGLNGFFGMRGVYCFEVGLRLGMLSLADFTPAGRPDSQGIGDYGLMGYGLFTGLGIVPAEPCAMNRMLMGWVDAVEIDSDTRVELPPIETGVGDTLLVKVPITDREYFLLEYRLQDPDGSFSFSFDDLNGNRVPDFYDADSSSGDGRPSSTFDPATDTWESTQGAEWDFFMSEFPVNDSDGPGRGPGRGNGLYVWHIDERVILESLNAGSNTINANPDRKGVDLEEADGVQDLDTLKASRFLLGWDRDCFRGEGVLIGDQLFGTRFADDTIPNSLSADGASIGFSISAIDSVQLGTEACAPGPYCPYGGRFLYRDRLGFDLAFASEPQAAGVTLKAQRKFAADGPRDDVRLADLDGDGVPEILLAGDEGALLVLHGDLTPWLAGADPDNPAVLARAKGVDGPPQWLGAPVVGDLDGDGTPEIFLSAREGVYAFDPQGNELRDGDADPASFGLFLSAPQVEGAPTNLSHPCLLAPHSGALADVTPQSRADLVMIFRGLQEGDRVGASLVEWDGSAAPSATISL